MWPTSSTGGGRWYALELPADADGRCRGGDARPSSAPSRLEPHDDGERALHETATATAILSEPFLSGDECAWVDERRAELRDLLVRALVVRTEVLCDASSPAAIAAAQALVDLEPEHEQSHTCC